MRTHKVLFDSEIQTDHLILAKRLAKNKQTKKQNKKKKKTVNGPENLEIRVQVDTTQTTV